MRLPATRDLADQYALSRGPVVNAFEQLKAEGYLDGSMGSGTYVSKILPDDLLQMRRAAVRPRPPAHRHDRRGRVSDHARRVQAFPGIVAGPIRAFRANLPALDVFPLSTWRQLAARRLRHGATNLLVGCDPTGYRPLRDAVADYLSASRGVRCTPEQVVIVSGVQEALDLAARLLLNPGDEVCMEDPGYPGAVCVFEAYGAKICAVRLDDHGADVGDLRGTRARLVYVTPAHQFPLGMTMSLPRRLELLEWARKSRAFIFEDDYDSEYRYAGRPVPALQGLDRSEVVLFAGSFSKVLFPSLRLGYLVVPPDLVGYVAAMKSATTRHAPLLEQAVLCDFIVDGHFGRHLRRMREIYSQRLSVLLEGARSRLAGLLEVSAVQAGLQTVGWLRAGLDGESVAQAASARGVEVLPLRRYCRDAAVPDGLLLGFAAVDARELRRAVHDFAAVLEEESGASRHRRRAP
jgi:GntR family transcriptional regulator/MocR family aminotransferase